MTLPCCHTGALILYKMQLEALWLNFFYKKRGKKTNFIFSVWQIFLGVHLGRKEGRERGRKTRREGRKQSWKENILLSLSLRIALKDTLIRLGLWNMLKLYQFWYIWDLDSAAPRGERLNKVFSWNRPFGKVLRTLSLVLPGTWNSMC